MNHLVGLELAGEQLPGLSAAEREALTAFRTVHEANRPEGAAAAPSFAVEAETLPASGWRELDDVTLFRFLCADRRKGKFCPEKSAKRLRGALAWRQERGVDQLLAAPPAGRDIYDSLRIRRWLGRDREGRPAQFERLGAFLASGNTGQYSAEEWIRFYTYDLETTFAEMRSAAAALGQPVVHYTFFGDLAGCVGGLGRELLRVIPLLTKLTNAVEMHYPEIVDHIVLFNAPWVFSTVSGPTSASPPPPASPPAARRRDPQPTPPPASTHTHICTHPCTRPRPGLQQGRQALP